MKNLTPVLFVIGLLIGSTDLPASTEREYAAGDVTIPLAYVARISPTPRPEALEFKEERGYPDNCQVFVRMEGELWEFKMRYTALPLEMPARYKGPDIDHMVKQEGSAIMPKGYLAWFLGGMWYDSAEKRLYAPMHVEALGVNRESPVAPWPSRKVILATSTDQGRTWRDEGDIITPETYFSISDTYKFSGSDYSNGLADFGFYADERAGYFYIFPTEAWIPKGTGDCRWASRAARCAMADKMAPGKWRMFHEGNWDEPALGGKSSIVAPNIWGVSYSAYLKKYICMFPSSGGTNVPEHYDGIYLGCCSDLSKQDWTWIRCPEAQFGFVNVMNAEGTDVGTFDRSIRFYSYFNHDVFQRLDLTFSKGQTVGQEIGTRYLFESHPESSDHVLSRQTKIIGSHSPEIEYAGDWVEKAEPSSYEGRFRECGSTGSMTFRFTGPAVYWRAERSPDSGQADVYLDGVLRKTVDCYSTQSTDFEQIVYLTEGLDAGSPHVIKIVVRGKKHKGSAGRKIRSIGFEYAAESYKASAGFCSIAGKNNWRYEEKVGGDDCEMRFAGGSRTFVNYWVGSANEIGPNYQCVNLGSSVREWVAPHDGVVRIEGQAEVTTWTDGVAACIEGDRDVLWPPAFLTANVPRVHDLTVKVRQGEIIAFVVKKENPERRSDASGDKVLWDPVITFARSAGALFAPDSPSDVNLALGKYARSKRLNHAYAPFNAVDGSADTTFSLSEADWTAHSGEEWLSVDLDRPHLVDRYVVVSSPKDIARQRGPIVLQKSDDGLSWSVVDRGVFCGEERIERGVPKFRARFVRILFPDGRPISISEFELYYTDGRTLPKSILTASRTK
jgi:hypothetical protein